MDVAVVGGEEDAAFTCWKMEQLVSSHVTQSKETREGGIWLCDACQKKKKQQNGDDVFFHFNIRVATIRRTRNRFTLKSWFLCHSSCISLFSRFFISTMCCVFFLFVIFIPCQKGSALYLYISAPIPYYRRRSPADLWEQLGYYWRIIGRTREDDPYRLFATLSLAAVCCDVYPATLKSKAKTTIGGEYYTAHTSTIHKDDDGKFNCDVQYRTWGDVQRIISERRLCDRYRFVIDWQ